MPLYFPVFLVVVDEAAGRQVRFLFMDRLKEYFKRPKDYGYEEKFNVVYNLDREFGYG